jgi:hypothetical protein
MCIITRRVQEEEPPRHTDVSDRLAAQGLPYPARCAVIQDVDRETRQQKATALCSILVDKIEVETWLVQTANRPPPENGEPAIVTLAVSAS